jgi:Tol biopolymer transport system component
MATGRQPFPGSTTAIIFTAILTQAPTSPISLNPELAPELERIINKALEKDREIRYQHASDLRADLKRLKRDTESGRAVAAVAPPSRRQAGKMPAVRWAAIALAGAVVITGVTLAYWLIHRPPPPAPQLKERRLTANASENAVNGGAISPDGKYLAYGDTMGMHLKLIQTGETVNIPQPQKPAPDAGNWWPNGWFPDSTKFLAAGREIGQGAWGVSVIGGPPRKLRDDADPWAVSPDGTLIAFGTGSGFTRCREIWLMGAQGEEPRRFVSGSENDGFFWAAWSPDGQRVAYQRFHRTPDTLECSIESRNLKGGQPTVIVSDPRLCHYWGSKFLWLPGGRFVYTMQGPDLSQRLNNLWETRVNPTTGEPSGKPRQITHWAETWIIGLSGTADGKQLGVTRWGIQTDIYVGELEGAGRGLKNPRRLTLEESNEYPGAWTPDSKAVLFWSDRNGTFDIFRQAVDQTSPEAVVTGPGHKERPVVSPDGSWILYLSVSAATSATTPIRIMRVPVSGGPSQLVLEGRSINGLACAQSPATLCAFSEPSPDQKQVVISALDPGQGRGRELTRVNLRQPSQGYSWDLSRDGSRLAFTQADDQEGRIQIFPLSDGKARDINVKGWNSLWRLSWATHGEGLFVSRLLGVGSMLLYVDLRGRANVLWQQRLPGRWPPWGIPSPDGRNLALVGYAMDSNVWMLENF